MKKKKILFLIILLLIIPILLILFYKFVLVCDSYGGIAPNEDNKAKYCVCSGKEIVIYDETGADGYRLSICLGIKKNVECAYVDKNQNKIECENNQ